MQQSPLSHGEIQNKFRAMVYQTLDDDWLAELPLA
jgi:hypothetical protein